MCCRPNAASSLAASFPPTNSQNDVPLQVTCFPAYTSIFFSYSYFCLLFAASKDSGCTILSVRIGYFPDNIYKLQFCKTEVRIINQVSQAQTDAQHSTPRKPSQPAHSYNYSPHSPKTEPHAQPHPPPLLCARD